MPFARYARLVDEHENLDHGDTEHGPEPETTVPDDERGVSAPGTARKRRWPVVVGAIGAVVALALIAGQLYLVATLDRTNDELASTRAELDAVETRLTAVDESIEALEEADAPSNPPADEPPAQTAPTLPDGFLPRFEPGIPDAALGLRLGAVSGPDAYTGEQRRIDPADGTKRVWMVWAHWCPYCQQELPSLSDLYPTLAEDYPDIEVETITSSIDPSRGNPLDAYLDSERFPFPVMVDADLSVAGRMGVSAFPFWMVTDGDGTVLLRMTGLMEEARLVGLMESLDEYES